MRNEPFLNHPFHQSSSHEDSNLQNDLSPLFPTTHVGRMKGQPPESPSIFLDAADDCKLIDVIRLPENLESLPKTDDYPTKRSRWNTNEEILALLLNFSKHEDWQSKDVVIRPESGSMLMYSRKKVRYRRDGYCWKKRKDGKTTREDHMKLKVQGVECIYGCYVHSAVLPTFHRRCYWLLQNPDIVLVHYLNVPYPDDSKLAAQIPNIAFWTEKKEWTREELLLQLKPMYESPPIESGKENETEEAKLNRINQISTFIESMVSQLLKKQKYVRAALANSLECGCGNRKCHGATRCTRPIRKISSAKKQSKRAAALSAKVQDKRNLNIGLRNVLKMSTIRKVAEISHGHLPSQSAYYGDSDLGTQSQIQADVQIMQPTNTKQMMSYGHLEVAAENYMAGVDFGNAENRHYQPSYSCPALESYVPNNEVENAAIKQEVSVNESMANQMTYTNKEQNEFACDKYQSDTTDATDSIHHQGSPDNNSFTSVEDAEAYGNGDVFDDITMNVNTSYNYENADCSSTSDHSLYELIIQLTQKDKKNTCSNSLVTCEKVQQYSIKNENCNGYASTNDYTSLQPLSDSNGNFLSSCFRYSTNANADQNFNNGTHHTLTSDFARLENNYVTSYPTVVDVNSMETLTEFSSTDRSISNHSVKGTNQSDPPCTIMDLAPDWSYCEGGTKLLIIGPWYFQSDYAVLFDGYSVPATLIQNGVLKCYCPEHAVGFVSLQVMSAGSIISNTVVFEYKKQTNFDENVCHDTCNTKTEQYNQYMCENDTLLKFILIQRIESIQDDAYKQTNCPAPPTVNKYEVPQSLQTKSTM